MNYLMRGAHAALFGLASLTASASPVLDPAFDGDGLRVVSGLGNGVSSVGSCPVEGGSLAVVAYDEQATQFVILRLRPDGDLDTAFSGDGIARETAPPSWNAKSSVMACSGVNNGNASDDEMALAFVQRGNPDLTRLARLNLQTGQFAADYFGQTSSYDISTLATGSAMLGDTRLGSLLRLGSGEWLLVGQLQGFGTTLGFAARFNAAMTWASAAATPTSAEANPQHLAAARVGGDGRIHALAHGTSSGGVPALLLLRLNSTTLQLDSATAYSRPADFRVHRGRSISGTTMVAAGSQPLAQGGGQPLLLVAHDSGVQELALPLPEALGGLPTNINASTAALPTATAAAGGRAIFAANLEADNGAAIGFYVAVIRPLPDPSEYEVDTRFGNHGGGSFRYTGNGGCWGSQGLGNISSWGNATALVATTSPTCNSGVEHPLIARIDTHPNPLLSDSFE
ncbi:MAG: hypothetical protein IPG63_19090 [Xanthomonadales bacterium]|nr:hypothetical protein [Xanthomonadales bacterium]MBK7144839.1 hypothetical protein [Xanthomonadales bacterium]MCC6561346.1 hypothetical protein [Xanthomonadales bacterium]